MDQRNLPTMGKIRGAVWPVYLFELKKVLPMLLMFFCIAFNYTILRDAKDTLVVTAMGAEGIPTLKLFFVLPAAFIFIFIYSRLSNMLSRPKLFYSVIGFLILFFGLFGFVIYPLQDYLHPHNICNAIQQFFNEKTLWGVDWGIRMAPFINVFRYWTYSAFYVLSEIWGSAALSLLFWGFANQITHVTEAKRFYALFGLGANVALMVSGPTIIMLADIVDKIPAGIDPWGVTLHWAMSLVVIMGCLAIFFYWWINRYVLTDPRFYSPAEQAAQKKRKPKLSLKKSVKIICTSKYLGLIAFIVIAYGLSINLVEVPWKGLIKKSYPTENAYLTFMGKFSTVTGFVTTCMILFVGHNVIRRLGWLAGALFTPILLFLTGAGFFTYYLMFKSSIFAESQSTLFSVFGWTITPLSLGVLLGAAQNILSKSTKYSLFDPTKEMTYIPLEEELKVSGKAAVDVVGARFGKSGGATINLITIGILGSAAAAPMLTGPMVVVTVIVWIAAATGLGKMFAQKQREKPNA